MLGVDFTSVDGEGFSIFKGLPALQELRLDSTGISDASIESLKSMHTLKVLNLYHTTVTEKGFEQLKAALPDCRVIFDRDSSLPVRRKT